MKQPLALLTVWLLVIMAALHIWRAAFGLDASLAGIPIPLGASWVAALFALALAVGLWFERRRIRDVVVRPAASTVAAAASVARAAPTPTAQASAPSRARNVAGAGHYESVMVDGRPVPAAYFMFASKVLSPAAIRKAKEKYGRVLVGFDAGYIPMSGEINGESFKVARDLGAELEIYVEGPGGATGNNGWDPGEAARVKEGAQQVGIDTSERGWRERHWDTTGWRRFTFQQLEYYRSVGFNAAEIDNVDRVVKGPAKLIELYKEYGALQTAGRLPQLVMKNVSAEDSQAVVEAVRSGDLPRSMFSEFHIFECGSSDDWVEVDQITKTIGIRTVPSRDTYNYDAKGQFGLDDEFNTAYGLDAARPAVPVS